MNGGEVVTPKPRTLSVSEDNANTTIKELPLTDIAVLPPPFDGDGSNLLTSDVLLELSEIAADSEAETDKMDFLHANGLADPPAETDLQVLSKINEMPGLDAPDSDVEEFMDGPRKRPINGDLGGDLPKRPRVSNGTTSPVASPPATEPNHELPENLPNGDAAPLPTDPTETPDREPSVPPAKPPREPSDDPEDEEEDGEGDGDNEDNDENEEEEEVDLNEQRQLAIIDVRAIEAEFAKLRDKLYHDKLLLLTRELQLCLEGLHPELLKIYFKINEFYQENVELANLNLAYRLKCINRETVATRTLIHQNFLKQLVDVKNHRITETTLLWYKINKERNQLDQLVEDFSYAALPTGPAGEGVDDGAPASLASATTKRAVRQGQVGGLVSQRNALNHQLGVLNGLVEFHGFPMAVLAPMLDDSRPQAAEELLLRQATPDEINDDLRAMGIL